MRVVVVVNRVSEIGFRQTTALLIASLARRGCPVFLADVDAFSFAGSPTEHRYIVHAAEFTPTPDCDSTMVQQIAASITSRIKISVQPDDLIWIRTNPGRDQQRIMFHETFLDIGRLLRTAGIRVVNDPMCIRYFASKASLALVDPAFRPTMMVSHDPRSVAEFVLTAGTDCVVKPLVGSRGQDVIRVSPDAGNPEDVIKRTFGDRGMIAQHFVCSDQPGDQRIVVVGGTILESRGHIGGIFRRPAHGEFRANIHAGGSPHPPELTEKTRAAVQHAATLLNENGIWLAGVDLVGDQIIEFNVFSTGGLFHANRFANCDFSDEIVSRLLSL